MNKEILRKIDRFERLIEIIESMRKPQIIFDISRSAIDLYSVEVKILAQNVDGICLYSFEGKVRAADRLLAKLDSFPRYVYVQKFRSYKQGQ